MAFCLLTIARTAKSSHYKSSIATRSGLCRECATGCAFSGNRCRGIRQPVREVRSDPTQRHSPLPRRRRRHRRLARWLRRLPAQDIEPTKSVLVDDAACCDRVRVREPDCAGGDGMKERIPIKYRYRIERLERLCAAEQYTCAATRCDPPAAA